MKQVFLEDLAKQVFQQIIKTDEYGAMRDAKDNLDKVQKAKEYLSQFQRDNEKMCKKRNELPEQEISEIKKRFEEMMQIPEVAAYFAAGQKLEFMLTYLYGYIDKMVGHALEET